MRRETLRQKLFTRRAAVLAGGQTLLLAAISGRMYQLQIIESDRYAVLADENRISLRLLAPLRARILDRFGIALAENQQVNRTCKWNESTCRAGCRGEWIFQRASNPQISNDKRSEAYTVLAAKYWDCSYKVTESPDNKVAEERGKSLAFPSGKANRLV